MTFPDAPLHVAPFLHIIKSVGRAIVDVDRRCARQVYLAAFIQMEGAFCRHAVTPASSDRPYRTNTATRPSAFSSRAPFSEPQIGVRTRPESCRRRCSATDYRSHDLTNSVPVVGSALSGYVDGSATRYRMTLNSRDHRMSNGHVHGRAS